MSSRDVTIALGQLGTQLVDFLLKGNLARENAGIALFTTIALQLALFLLLCNLRPRNNNKVIASCDVKTPLANKKLKRNLPTMKTGQTKF